MSLELPKYIILQAPSSLDEAENKSLTIRKQRYALGTYNKKLVSLVLRYNGFQVGTTSDSHILWKAPHEADVTTPYSFIQKLNHFPFSKQILGDKAQLANIIQNNQFLYRFVPFFPHTYIFPQDRDLLFREMKANTNRQFISKPPKGSCGHGIQIVNYNTFYTIPSGAVVQNYVSKPLTIDGFKFDLRIYVLVTSFAPLRAFIYKDGLARFATESYKNSSNTSKFSHLTNATLNKKSANWSSDFKWTLDELLREVEHRFKHSTTEMFGKLEKVVSQTLALIQPAMCPAERTSPFSPYFEIYGFDILVDANYDMWLLEVNTFPALGFTEDADFNVKAPMIAGALSIAGIADTDLETLKKGLVLPGQAEEIDQLIVKQEDERNKASGDHFKRLFPTNDPLLNSMLVTPKLVKPQVISTKGSVDPIQLGKLLTQEQGLEILLMYLKRVDQELRSENANTGTIIRVANFLAEQGYHTERGGTTGLKSTLRMFMRKIQANIQNTGSFRSNIPDTVKKYIFDTGDAYISAILQNCELMAVKSVGVLFNT